MTRHAAQQPDEIRTRRLVLRRWRESDLVAFRVMNADPDVMRYFARLLTADESDAAAHRLMGFCDDGLGPWAVEVPGEAGFIGFTGCLPVRPELPFAPAIEAGWRLGQPFWGRGLATEAAAAALSDAFGRGGCDEIVAYAAAGNAPSRAVMDRLGMVRDLGADFEHPLVPEGHPNRLHVLYRLRRERFLAEGRVPR